MRAPVWAPPPGVGIANLAMGLADSYTEIGPRALTIWRGCMCEGFAQDSWKVTEKLHIDYGVRWTTIRASIRYGATRITSTARCTIRRTPCR